MEEGGWSKHVFEGERQVVQRVGLPVVA
jgi:hypothetical protein